MKNSQNEMAQTHDFFAYVLEPKQSFCNFIKFLSMFSSVLDDFHFRAPVKVTNTKMSKKNRTPPQINTT